MRFIIACAFVVLVSGLAIPVSDMIRDRENRYSMLVDLADMEPAAGGEAIDDADRMWNLERVPGDTGYDDFGTRFQDHRNSAID